MTQRASHLAALDGLRGIAALAVMLMHIGTWLDRPWLAPNSILAVDFFFCLSGYVLSLAYGPRFDRGMTAASFLRIRLIRLMPVIVIATAISVAYALLRHYVAHDAVPVGRLAVYALSGALCLPWLGVSRGVGGDTVFPLNFPQYTLFLELVVNAAWAVLRPLDRLAPALGIAAAGYAACAIWGMDGVDLGTFWTGFPRVFAGFYAGVAIFHARARWAILSDPRWGRWFAPLLALTLVVFLLPFPLPFALRWLWCVIVSPMLVVSGAHVEWQGGARRTALVLGALSYPLYALHWPILVWVNGLYQQLSGHRDIGIALIGAPAVVVGSWLVLHGIDQPVRARLTALARTARRRT